MISIVKWIPISSCGGYNKVSLNDQFWSLMKSFIVAILMLFSLGVRADDPLCRIAKSAFQDVVEIRGHAKKREVPCKVQNIEEVKRFLLNTINKKISPTKMEMEELVYKAVGMIPEDFDYRKGLVEFYASQAGGYYNPEKKEFVMAAWMPGLLQTTVAVHELTHALQDQYYDLEAFTDDKKFTTDELLARSALIEGDATAVMTDYARKLIGQPGIGTEADVDGMMLQNAIGFSVMAANVSVPKGIQMLLFFPYTSGLRFVHRLLRQGGYRAVDKAYKRVPLSTTEILHPEKYLKEEATIPEKLSVNEVLASSGEDPGAMLYKDVLGEFFISVLLQSLGENGLIAAQGAAGLRADCIVVVAKAGGGKAVYWQQKWESLKDLTEFSTSYQFKLKESKKKGTYAFSADEKGLITRIVFGSSTNTQ